MGEKGATRQEDGSGAGLRIAVVVARYNHDIGKRLLRGAVQALRELGVEEPEVYWVPGAIEIPVTALALAESGVDAVVCLGCVIRGETAHFDFVAGECASGVVQVSLDTGVPCTFGVLTTFDKEQALARSGPKSNKGAEAAEAAVEMAKLLRKIQG